MTLDELMAAFNQNDGQVDLTDASIFPDGDLDSMMDQAIQAGTAMAPAQLDQKRQMLMVATAINDERNNRAINAANAAEDAASIDNAFAALTDSDAGETEPPADEPPVDPNAPPDANAPVPPDANSPIPQAAAADPVAASDAPADPAPAADGAGDQPPTDPPTAPPAEVPGEPAEVPGEPAAPPAAPVDPNAVPPEAPAPAPVDPAAAPVEGVPVDPPADPPPIDPITGEPIAPDPAAVDPNQPPADPSAAPDPAPVTGDPEASTTAGDDDMTTATDNDRVGALESQVAALTEQIASARLAGVSLGDTPGQAQETAPAPPRTASMQIMGDDGQHVRTLDVGILGARLAAIAESHEGSGAFNNIIATINRFEPGTESLRMGAGARNTELLFDGTPSRRAARTASSMNCGPVSRVETIPQCFIADRPFADAVTNKWPLETMKYEFYRSLSISSLADPNGSQIVTETTMLAIDPADDTTWKQCARLDCNTVETVQEQGWAVWSCLILNEFQNFTIIPIAENRINLLAVTTARLAESQLLARLRALSYQYTAVAPLGAGPGLLEIMDAAVTGYEWVDRLADIKWTPVIPRGLARALATDHANQAFRGGEAFNLNTYFTDRGYNQPVVVLDDYLGAGSAQYVRTGTIGASVALKTMLKETYRIALVDFDSIHMGQRNVITLRELRDLNLTRMNEYAMVMETAESLGRHGCVAPIAIDVTICPSGARAALERYDCTAATYGADIATGA